MACYGKKFTSETVEEMITKNLVSAIVVNFNAESCLEQCLKSIASSLSFDVEVIVVDNASTDKSVDVLKTAAKENSNLQVIWNRENVGFARACNQALKYAQGEYILFLNPDCIILEKTLEDLVHTLEQNSKIGMVGPLIINPDGSEQAGARRKVPTPWRSLMQTLGLWRIFPSEDFRLHKTPLPSKATEVDAISGAFMLVKREALQEVGTMDEGYFMHCEDLDLAMRFKEAGWQILFVPHAKALHHKGVSSNGRGFPVLWHMHVGMLRFYKKFFRHKYPLPIMGLVYVGVWLRFSLLATLRFLKYGIKPRRARALR